MEKIKQAIINTTGKTGQFIRTIPQRTPKPKFSAIKPFFQNLPKKINPQTIKQFFSGIIPRIKSFFSNLIPGIKQLLPKIIPAIKNLPGATIQFFKNLKFKKTGQFALLIIAIIYLFGLGYLMLSLYREPDPQTKNQNINKITKTDKFIQTISKIYPLPAAKVNGELISVNEFFRQENYIKNFNSNVPNSVSSGIKNESALHDSILTTLVNNEVIRQQAEKNKIYISDKDIENAYKSAADANGGKDKIDKILQDLYGMKPDEFKKMIGSLLLREKISKELLTQYAVSHILVPDQKLAEGVIARLEKGENFSDVAAAVSEDSNSKSKGGDLGWLGLQDLAKVSPEIQKATIVLAKGQLSAPIKTQYGFHIIKLVDKKGKIDKDFDVWLKDVEKNTKIKRYIK